MEKSTWKQARKIGSGGYGDVWLQKEESGELRAVKELRRRAAAAGPSQELLALVKLKNHDHLFVRFLGWYENEAKMFLAMEYLRHGDLSGYIPNGEMKGYTGEITRQILEGLEVLHEKDIFHRDLKPQNILVASLDPIWVKITDFGIAKRAKGTVLRTRCGTEGYISPELHGMISRKDIPRGPLGFAIDIWALGCLVHVLLTSEIPFLEPEDEYDSASSVAEPESQPRTDMFSLREYCDGAIPFPEKALVESNASKEQVDFVKALLVPNPRKRPNATIALGSPWLKGYTNDWFEKLGHEFSSLGVNSINNPFVARQAREADILQLLKIPTQRVPSLLREAIEKGYDLAVSRLLRSVGDTFLLTIRKGNFDEARAILKNGLGINVRIGLEMSDLAILDWAVEEAHLMVINLLLENPNTRIPRADYTKAVFRAISLERVGIVETFMRKGFIDTIATDSDGQTAVQIAVKTATATGNSGTVALLLDRDFDTPPYSDDPKTARLLARAGFVKKFTKILDMEPDLGDQVGPEILGMMLEIAVEGGHIDAIKVLLENNAKIHDSVAVMQAAAGGGHIDIVKLLLESNADVNAEKGYNLGRTALQAAAGGGHINIIKLLLENNADVNASVTSRWGRTALQAAAGAGHIDIVKLLLKGNNGINAARAAIYGLRNSEADIRSWNPEIVRILEDVFSHANS